MLLYEAVLQLILWRTGKRTSLELLSEIEEQALHETAHHMALQTDWVRDVARMRDSKVRLLKKQAIKENVKSTNIVGGTRSRPKTVVSGRV